MKVGGDKGLFDLVFVAATRIGALEATEGLHAPVCV
jgi:hypothetical protein